MNPKAVLNRREFLAGAVATAAQATVAAPAVPKKTWSSQGMDILAKRIGVGEAGVKILTTK